MAAAEEEEEEEEDGEEGEEVLRQQHQQQQQRVLGTGPRHGQIGRAQLHLKDHSGPAGRTDGGEAWTVSAALLRHAVTHTHTGFGESELQELIGGKAGGWRQKEKNGRRKRRRRSKENMAGGKERTRVWYCLD